MRNPLRQYIRCLFHYVQPQKSLFWTGNVLVHHDEQKDTSKEDFQWHVVDLFSERPIPRERFAATAVINLSGKMWTFGGELQDAERYARASARRWSHIQGSS